MLSDFYQIKDKNMRTEKTPKYFYYVHPPVEKRLHH